MALVAIAAAQPARTTIADTLFRADGSRFSGSVTCSWPSFQTADGYNLSAGNITLRVSNGSLSGLMVPTDSLSGSSANARYTCRYALTNGQPLSPPLQETWNVPTSGPAALDDLRDPNPPPFTSTAAPLDAPFITYASSGGLSSERSLGSLADNSVVVCDVSAASCTPRAALYTDIVPLWVTGGVCDATTVLFGDGHCDNPGSVSTPTFDNVQGGTNEGETLTVGDGSTLTYTGTGAINARTLAGTTPTAFGLSLMDDAAASNARTTMGLVLDTDIYAKATADTLLAAKVAGASSLTTASVIPRVTASGELGPSKLSCTGTPVTCTFYDDTAVTGVMSIDVQAGAGQSTTNLMRFLSNAGAVQSVISSDGAIASVSGGFRKAVFATTTVGFSSDGILNWRDNTSYDAGTPDIGLGRSAANIACVNQGGADCTTKGDLLLRSPILSDRTEPTCDSSARGAIDMDQGGAGVADTIRACVKLADDTYEWRPLL